ncbi:hypothetical protein Tco_0598535 [Tanacetum coccineum]
MGPYFLLDKLSEVAESLRLGDKMKYVFGRSRSEDESLGSLIRNLCSALRVSLSNKRRLVAELEVLGELEGVVKSLEHMRVIVGRDAVTLEELEALWARAQVRAALKAGFMADMEYEAEFIGELKSFGVRHVPAKPVEFLKEIQLKDRENVAQMQILEREIELNASKKELFIKKLDGLVPY